jgi:hypothetical protein
LPTAGDYLTGKHCENVFRLHEDIQSILADYSVVLNNCQAIRTDSRIKTQLLEIVKNSFETVKTERTLLELENVGIPKVLCNIIVLFV